MKVYDYYRRNNEDKYGRLLTEEEVAELVNAINNKCAKFTVKKIDTENSVVYGATEYIDNY